MEKSIQLQQHEANLAMFKELQAQITMQQALTLLLVTDLGAKGMLSTGFLDAFRKSVPDNLPPDEAARCAELFNGTADSFEALIEKAKATVKK